LGIIRTGTAAPDFTLEGIDGKSYSLSEALKQGPVLVAFFKVCCPVCQFTFPYLERLHETYGNSKLTLWGISQDDAEDTREFCKEFEITFPELIDANGYSVSNRYGITNVPSIFLIGTDGKIRVSETGFSKKDLEQVASEFAAASDVPPSALFTPSDIVPDYKPG
jgi:peroxiredoxin